MLVSNTSSGTISLLPASSLRRYSFTACILWTRPLSRRFQSAAGTMRGNQSVGWVLSPCDMPKACCSSRSRPCARRRFSSQRSGPVFASSLKKASYTGRGVSSDPKTSLVPGSVRSNTMDPIDRGLYVALFLGVTASQGLISGSNRPTAAPDNRDEISLRTMVSRSFRSTHARGFRGNSLRCGVIWCREVGLLPLYWLQDGAGAAYTSGGEAGAGREGAPLRSLDAPPRGRGCRPVRALARPPRRWTGLGRGRGVGRDSAVCPGERRGFAG